MTIEQAIDLLQKWVSEQPTATYMHTALPQIIAALLRTSQHPATVTLPTHEGPLSWRHVSKHPELFEDGTQYLVAVPVRNRRIDETKCYWEYSVIMIHCDEGVFRETLDGESWGWQWCDVEYYIPLSEFRLPGTDTKPPGPVAMPTKPEGEVGG